MWIGVKVKSKYIFKGIKMRQPSPEKKKFMGDNKEELGKIIQRENNRRSKRGVIPLSNDEIGDAIDTMMDIVSGGGRLREYTFPATANPIEPKKVAPPTTGPSPGPVIQSQRMTPKPREGEIIFSISRCLNGFMLGVSDKELPYIFKNKKELFDIMEDVVFTKQFLKPKAEKPMEVETGKHSITEVKDEKKPKAISIQRAKEKKRKKDKAAAN
jgi:hypothetical protein